MKLKQLEQASKVMRQYSFVKGRQLLAPKIVVYGVEGIGKSTFASKFPKPFFIDVEDRTRHLDVVRFVPGSFSDVIELLDDLTDNYNDICEQVGYEIKTLVIDTVDWLQKLATEYVCLVNGIKSIEAMGYGKGWVLVAEQMLKIVRKLDQVNRMDINVVCVCHSTSRKFEDAIYSTCDRYTLKLLAGDKISVADMFKEWCDCLFFMNYLFINNEDKQEAKRVIFTEHTISFDAKNSFNLPPMIDAENSDTLINILTREGLKYDKDENKGGRDNNQ